MKTFLGGALVMLCSFLLGRMFTDTQRRQIVHLKALIEVICRIRDSINMSMSTLPEIYEGIEFLTGETAFIKHSLIRSGLYETLKELCLSGQGRAAAREFAYTLGSLDGTTQKAETEKAITRLTEIYDAEKSEYTNKSKSITALFCLAGGIAVILIM